jgi:hypothetical protein
MNRTHAALAVAAALTFAAGLALAANGHDRHREGMHRHGPAESASTGCPHDAGDEKDHAHRGEHRADMMDRMHGRMHGGAAHEGRHGNRPDAAGQPPKEATR